MAKRNMDFERVELSLIGPEVIIFGIRGCRMGTALAAIVKADIKKHQARREKALEAIKRFEAFIESERREVSTAEELEAQAIKYLAELQKLETTVEEMPRPPIVLVGPGAHGVPFPDPVKCKHGNLAWSTAGDCGPDCPPSVASQLIRGTLEETAAAPVESVRIPDGATSGMEEPLPAINEDLEEKPYCASPGCVRHGAHYYSGFGYCTECYSALVKQEAAKEAEVRERYNQKRRERRAKARAEKQKAKAGGAPLPNG